MASIFVEQPSSLIKISGLELDWCDVGVTAKLALAV